MGSSNLKERALAGQAPRFGWNVCCHNVPKMSMSWVGAATGLLGRLDCPLLISYARKPPNSESWLGRHRRGFAALPIWQWMLAQSQIDSRRRKKPGGVEDRQGAIAVA
jgi:hypothetical protein